jgi:hypothetical protein
MGGALKHLSVKIKGHGVKASDLEGLPRFLRLPKSIALQLHTNGVIGVKSTAKHDHHVWQEGCNYGVFMAHMRQSEVKV